METNRIIHGGALTELKDLSDNSVDAVVTDPPYNINKAEWDSIENYTEWLCDVFSECGRVLKDIGTLWYFHMDFEAMSQIDSLLSETTDFQHKQLITIDKGMQSAAGRTSKELRSFPKTTEYLQFYTRKNESNVMGEYLQSELDRAGASHREIAELFPSKNGNITGCVFNWVNGNNFPLREQYETIRRYLNKEYEGDYLTREYDELESVYQSNRYTFNPLPRTRDVWELDFYNNGVDHPTAKPVDAIRTIIKSSTLESDVVLDPFIGSGTTAVACKQTNRQYIGVEKDKEYIKMSRERVENQPASLTSF